MPQTKYEAAEDFGSKFRNSRRVPPDGGWGWVIVFGGFISMMLASLPMTGFGILFSPLLMNHNVSSSKVSWIFNVHVLVWNLFALTIGPLCQEFGCRKVAIFGGIMNFISLVMSAFVPSPEYLFFSFSVIGGIGGSTGVTITLIVVSRYFEKRRGFALGITAIGMCTSAFVSPLLSTTLHDKYEYMGAILVFASVVLNQCVGACLFQPVEWHMKDVEVKSAEEPFEENLKPESEEDSRETFIKILNLRRMSTISVYSCGSFTPSVVDVRSKVAEPVRITDQNPSTRSRNSFVRHVTNILESSYENLKSLRFLRVNIIAIGAGCLMLGCNNFQMWIPFVVMNAGYSLHMAAWCVSAASIANAIGKLCMSSLSDHRRFNIRIAYMFGILFIGLFIIAFAYAGDVVFLLIIVCGWGFNIGTALSLNPTVMIDVMGVENFPAIFGVSSWFVATFGIVLGPIIGLIRDVTLSYRYALSILGSLQIFAFCLWTLMPFAAEYDYKRTRKKVNEAIEL